MTRVRGPEIRNAANSTSLAFAGESSAHILHLTLGPLGRRIQLCLWGSHSTAKKTEMKMKLLSNSELL